MTNNKKEYISVSVRMEVDGYIKELKRVRYVRGRETYAFTLDDLARIIFMWEHRLHTGSTRLMDGFLQEAEQKLLKADNETAESLFNKYWINYNKTLQEEFDSGKSPKWFEKDEYLLYLIASLCRTYYNAPHQIKQGFLYWLRCCGNISEIDKETIPENIMELVNKLINTDS